MRLRSFILAFVLAAGFVWFTSGSRWNPLHHFYAPSAGATLWSGPASVRGAGLTSDELNNIEIFKASKGATVFITSVVYEQTWFFQIVPRKGTGTGFIINFDGEILTNHHVIVGDSKELQVKLSDQSSYRARILSDDKNNDLALIKIEPRKKLPFLRLGDSDALQVGQKVLAIGNPFRLQNTLTTGIVSSLGRTVEGEEGGPVLEDAIQTDAAINPGNSGGPLLDSSGNVIGINTAIYGNANVGIGFAVPINRAKVMMEWYRQKGSKGRPNLGVKVAFVAGDEAEQLDLPREGGLLILGIDRGSLAEQVDLRGPRKWSVVGNYRVPVGGDLIVAVDGQPVDASDSLSRALSRHRPGDTLRLTIYRDGNKKSVAIKLE
jgi:S1-C subfamily serine protease